MAMTLSEFNRLKKMMMLTTSPNDAEALSALRKANEVLAAFSYDWNAVFGRLVKVEGGMPEIEAAPEERSLDDEITEAFQKIFDAKKDNSFINSLYEQYQSNHFLSELQREALFKNARRL